MLAEKQRAAKRESLRSTLPPRSRKSSTTSTKRKSGVSLAGSSGQMSILELLQNIVNEPPPQLPGGGKFSLEAEEFINASLRKEPVGYNVKKKGPLPEGIARPTPRQLLVRPAPYPLPFRFPSPNLSPLRDCCSNLSLSSSIF
jgi:mitogen-activated protein kinase kinase